ncbi:MAG TPA: Hint domain-containing protein [Acetobacteraceae bacterium]|nr:Hint domain-containing protein [Acetobacteraceae bacterium]
MGDGQSTTSLTLHPQDSENVFSGGRSIDTTILHAGTETVYAGGVASFTTISDDGYQVISVGGFATGATVDFGGIEGLSFSGTARGITVESSGNQTVEELGSSIDAIVHSSGTETIAGGALSIATTISSGGFETVASGGVTSDTTVRGDYEIIHAGAVVEDTIMSGGSAVILGSAVSTIIRGGYEGISGGTATDTTVSSSGYLTISTGGFASDTTVSRDGYEYVFSGMANNTTGDSGGTDFVSSGGAVNFTTIASGGLEYIYFSGVARGTRIDSGGDQFILSGGSAGGAAIDGGKQYVYSGATANFTTVVGGDEFIYSGAVAYATTISHDGLVEVESPTGIAIATTVRSAADLYVAAGSVNFATISSGGYDHVSYGVTNGTTVLNGGSENIVDGGVAVSTTISSGGTEYVASCGVASDITLVPGGTIDVRYFAYASGGTANLTSSSDVLIVTEGGHTYTQQMSGSYAGEYFHLDPDTGTGTLITENGNPCYCEGTPILTIFGEVSVENLAIGDQIITVDGVARAIRWIGHRHVELLRHKAPALVRPIIIHADAFADGVPRCDLWLSPDHAVLLDGVLVPVTQLINGASVQRDIQCRAVAFYHVELDAHDILLAENLPAESYLDTGNRKHFENAGMSIVLHPDFGDGQARHVVESCRPFADDVTGVEWTWQRIATRATLLGFHVPVDFETTADPELHIAIDGRVIRPIGAQAGRLVFALPPGGWAGAPGFACSRALRWATVGGGSPAAGGHGVAVDVALRRCGRADSTGPSDACRRLVGRGGRCSTTVAMD